MTEFSSSELDIAQFMTNLPPPSSPREMVPELKEEWEVLKQIERRDNTDQLASLLNWNPLHRAANANKFRTKKSKLRTDEFIKWYMTLDLRPRVDYELLQKDTDGLIPYDIAKDNPQLTQKTKDDMWERTKSAQREKKDVLTIIHKVLFDEKRRGRGRWWENDKREEGLLLQYF
ncbi:MAG TPA: hypothetical protein DCE52_02610 [Rhodobacteraceae bacterium]|mgnify:CR=1 FL=1|nr:hypothetical protein [Paracoccaceae bacterium]